MDELSKQALRVLRLFGDTTTKKVTASIGPEQEYFLIDKKTYEQREDLIMTGRTLFGAKPPKGQEMDDHYFGTLKPRIAAYMKDLDEELWKLGILAKTKHNEVAPAQHELAPIFSDANTAADHNQLTMEIMKKVAAKHGLVCLLHESPLPVSTAPANTTTGPFPPIRAETCWIPARPPATMLSSCCFWRPSSRAWTIIRKCCAAPWPPPVTTTAWAPTKRLLP